MVELLIAILIMLVGIVSVAQLVPMAIDTNFRNRNDSTALIAAQRLLEQMAAQPLDVQSTVQSPGINCIDAPPDPVNTYYFCDQDGDLILLGAQDTTLGASVTTENGCPLAAAGQIDFTIASPGNCNPNGTVDYGLKKQWVWNPVTNTTQTIELRWRVIGWHAGGAAMRKVFIVGARAGTAGQGLTVTDLQTVVGR
jgi:type II secretory pathway pseudopilin PulG